MTKAMPADPVSIKARERQPKAAVIVADELRRQIVSGRLRPGDKLQPENVLQTEFKVSRPTLREALRILESESLITISRGKYGGARVTSVDIRTLASQVGMYLQIQGTTLEEIWFARIIIEPPAAALLAANPHEQAFVELEANIAAAREASQSDLLRYADLSAGFSLLLMRLSANKPLHLLGSLIYDIIRRQHENVTLRTLSKASVHKLRLESIESREKAVALMRHGEAARVETFWREHLYHMRDLVLSEYNTSTTIEMLNHQLPLDRTPNISRKESRPSFDLGPQSISDRSGTGS
jgi:GntR family transcriptional repressor for pyruvate dehydrogenase complex